MQRFAVFALILAVAGSVHARGLSASTECETCIFTTHVLDDLLCDPWLDDQAASWLDDNVCALMGDNKQQCIDMVNALMPAAIEWIRANLNPDGMCANVCPSASLAQVAAKAKPAYKDDMLCPLCMFVVGKVKETLTDPTTQEQVREKSEAACDLLPEGSMRDGCKQWVDEQETRLFNALNTGLEPEAVCQMAGTCLASVLAKAAPPAPLSPRAVAALSRAVALISAPPANDNCETCKLVIQEIHSVVANPDLQQQMVDYAKQACTLVASMTTQCQADVDQYAPMVFGMVLAYLQPEQVCEQVHFCPAPSAAQQLQSQVALTASLALAKFKTAAAAATAKVATS